MLTAGLWTSLGPCSMTHVEDLCVSAVVLQGASQWLLAPTSCLVWLTVGLSMSQLHWAAVEVLFNAVAERLHKGGP